jgi:hypothetical protein
MSPMASMQSSQSMMASIALSTVTIGVSSISSQSQKTKLPFSAISCFGASHPHDHRHASATTSDDRYRARRLSHPRTAPFHNLFEPPNDGW